ncbi:ankyrin repeat domain-containing protein [Pseudomonas sp. L1(2025)]|uniref:ankyrin repeat domain-containing protein n=1 Tax=Pseudomonas sp. L1(2025) TaxID=3449429 RepID=UPI003F68F336
MKVISLVYVMCLPLLLLDSIAYAGLQLAGKTVEQVYEDPKVASLVNAAIDGRVAEVERLVASGANPNTVGKDGTTPLFWALNSKSASGVEALLNAGADTEKVTPQSRGFSPMALVSGGNNPDLLALMLRYKADANGVNAATIKTKPLYLAAAQGRLQNVKLILDAGADVNVHDDTGLSAATVAAAMGNFEIVAFLLDRGYTYDLSGLAKDTHIVKAFSIAEGPAWKAKVIDKLKAKGVN